ncbi:MAG TPA: hypothetical protein VHA56_19485 [Mucilaginibacter sp.]|nr:hypothetical protein [Mucilaginibacter sp.]
MRRIYFLFMVLSACILVSCSNKSGNDPANSQPKLIVGKWTLQRQTTAVFIDGVAQPVVTASASDKTYGYAQFDGSGYTSVSYYNSGGIGSTGVGNVIAADTVRGTYSFSGSAFNLSVPVMAGFEVGTFTTNTGSPAIIRLVSQSSKITQLTTSVFELHIEYTTTHTTEAGASDYKNVLDYYYTR